MNNKGITLTTVVVSVILMLILAGTITVSIFSTINYSKISVWINEIVYIQDIVEEHLAKTSVPPYTSATVNIDISGLSSEERQKQFASEVIENNLVTLNVLDLGTLKITNTTYGNLQNEQDVYAYSNVTGKVYYVKGINIDSVMTYTVTDELRNKHDLIPANTTLQSIVFIPNTMGYTNLPISVTIRIPKEITNINITTNNTNINVSGQTVTADYYEYVVNTNSIAGNYDITVNYTFQNVGQTTRYVVNTYDITAPIIEKLAYENIVYVETENAKIEYISNVKATDASGIKKFKYTIGTISQVEAKGYFAQNGNDIVGGKINLDREDTSYTIYAEDNAGNFSIISFDKKHIMPDAWKNTVSYIQDRVPIPKGFAASKHEDENSKEDGLVIYALTETEIANGVTEIPLSEEQSTSWKNRNQFVWVPVPQSTFKTQFRREGNLVGDTFGTNFWEVELDNENMPVLDQNDTFVSPTTEKEVRAMYESVKKYGGFYVGRYEAGSTTQRISSAYKDTLESNLYITMGKYPYLWVKWSGSDVMNVDTGGCVQQSRNLYPASSTVYGAASHLIYGVEWDAILWWWKQTGAVSDFSDSTAYGNYSNHIIKPGELNEDAEYSLMTNSVMSNYALVKEWNTKPAGTIWFLTTGALKAAKVKNIYDMAGNVFEWRMDGYDVNNRVAGAGCAFYLGEAGVNYDYFGTQTATGYFGFRVAMYVK